MRASVLLAALGVSALTLVSVGSATAAGLDRPYPNKARKYYRAAPGEEIIVIRRYGTAGYRYRAFDHHGPIYPADYGPYEPYRPYYYRYPYAAEPFPQGFWWW